MDETLKDECPGGCWAACGHCAFQRAVEPHFQQGLSGVGDGDWEVDMGMLMGSVTVTRNGLGKMDGMMVVIEPIRGGVGVALRRKSVRAEESLRFGS